MPGRGVHTANSPGQGEGLRRAENQPPGGIRRKFRGSASVEMSKKKGFLPAGENRLDHKGDLSTLGSTATDPGIMSIFTKNFAAIRTRLSLGGSLLPIAGMCLVIIGARLWLIRNFCNPTPFFDAWCEPFITFKPWLSGTLHFADLFTPHNDHRIFTCRALALLLFIINNQQWDPQLQMVANTLIATAIPLFLIFVVRNLDGKLAQLLIPLLALMFALPFGWENTLFGFASQFYFLVFFSLTGMCGLLFCESFSKGWLAGWFSCFCACFSMGSGLFAPAMVLALMVLRFIRTRQFTKGMGWTCTAALVVVAVGFALRVPLNPVFKVNSLYTFLISLSRNLSWPNSYYHPAIEVMLVPIMWLPFLILLASYLLQRLPAASTKLGEYFLAIGLWVVLSALATSYARGLDAWPPPSRYMDVLAFGFLVNLATLFFLVGKSFAWYRGYFFYGLLVIWMGVSLAGLLNLTRKDFTVNLPLKKFILNGLEWKIKAFLQTGDPRFIEKKSEWDPIPSVSNLTDTVVATILPFNLRLPLPLTDVSGSGFDGIRRASVAPVVPGEKILAADLQSASSEWLINGTRQPFLYLRAAGQPGSDLELSQDGVSKSIISVSGLLPDQWTAIWVPIHAGSPLILRAKTTGGSALAFTGPVEVAGASLLAVKILGAAEILFWSGLAFISFYYSGLLLTLFRRQT